MREIMLDTETTGLSPKEGHRLVEIGCVEMVNRFPTGNVWHEYFNPERSMPEAAYKIHGLSDEFLAGKPLFGELADGFLEFIDGARLVIHNAPFDIGFLNFELEMLGKPAIAMSSVVDTLLIARQKFPGASNNLDALCRRFGIDNSAREKHGALLDSELLAEVYLELIGGHQAGLDFGAAPTSGLGADRGAASVSGDLSQEMGEAPKSALPAREMASLLDDEELRTHREFIASLGDSPLWKKYH